MKYLLIIITVLLLQRENAVCQTGQIADSSRYLQEVKNELNKLWPQNRTINLVFHGHSVPAGYGARHEVHTLDAYPQQVLKQLKKNYPYAVINIIVTAIGGENSFKGAARFEKDVLVHKPDVLFIDYALNDRTQGLDSARMSWEKMIQQAQAAHIKVILLTPSPDKRVNIFATDKRSLSLHAAQIRELAVKYHTGLADPFARFQELSRKEGGTDQYMISVNHPNAQGHAVIAGEIMKWLMPAEK